MIVDAFWQDIGGEFSRRVARELVDSIVGGSPYLRGLILKDTGFALRAFTTPPLELLDHVIEDLKRDVGAHSQPQMMQALRRAKSQAALLIAIADISGQWSVEQVTAALTRLADESVGSALRWLLLDSCRAGKLQIADERHPERGCGYVVLAMGKHGAFELNYSSDIDLIILFDPETAPVAPGAEHATFFVRLTKRLVALLQDVTEDGYAFRVDLRLRPDPRATQVAISIEAAAIYYENMGQNWERAAMIKARPAAGDLALGDEFMARLRPYIWRKYLDFAAIADVQSLKRQIHAVKGHGTIAIRGHNIKLGRGGIREIEFFVQTQQLIAGGRNSALRGRGTVGMLGALAEADWISSLAAAELVDAYRFLRTVEHRIQMVNDEQTHNLPTEDNVFEALARFCGFPDSRAFSDKLLATFECVQGHYAALFEDASELASDAGSLVFTGGEDDPETLETLTRMGFRSPSEVSATIRGWHFGRYAATRSAKSRELLTELMPALLSALARSGDADQAFLAFDRFLAGLPAGVQLFSLLKANPKLLDLIATILGTAPRLADQLSRRPQVLDAVLDPGFFDALPTADEMKRAQDQAIPMDTSLEDVIDRARIIGKEQAFRIGVRVLSETVGAADAGRAFSELAGLLITRLHCAVEQDTLRRHGAIAGGSSAVIAMGKLGGLEMTAGSDLDLIMIYNADRGADVSDGAKPLGVSQYYSRLTQRLISALSAPTAEGVLYEVDMRLRPSGSQGPVAANFESFMTYHAESSWTWEKLALTRARVICGSSDLKLQLEGAIRQALCARRDREKTFTDVLEMRKLMLKEHGRGGVWDIKRVRGGLVEVEFVAQALQLVHASAMPDILATNSMVALRRAVAAGVLDQRDGQALLDACMLYHRLTQVLRLCVSDDYQPATSPAGLNRIVASAAATPDILTAEALLADTQSQVTSIFDRLIGPAD
ncbi:MAG: bifunctional [glutamine synthetase] adenylyltransferase/[glutamine synthetase]-adenylyl-L-tyrosine phosphorylase [Alphaproteobacteria bacterium]|nr:bifunctional [glutamine synthetase] adenylyltransferase/[glutamine synthetase]-adenylyl-L-tyrosine phosphorylase [Alphaproteobacteria bacterium]